MYFHNFQSYFLKIFLCEIFLLHKCSYTCLPTKYVFSSYKIQVLTKLIFFTWFFRKTTYRSLDLQVYNLIFQEKLYLFKFKVHVWMVSSSFTSLTFTSYQFMFLNMIQQAQMMNHLTSTNKQHPKIITTQDQHDLTIYLLFIHSLSLYVSRLVYVLQCFLIFHHSIIY